MGRRIAVKALVGNLGWTDPNGAHLAAGAVADRLLVVLSTFSHSAELRRSSAGHLAGMGVIHVERTQLILRGSFDTGLRGGRIAYELTRRLGPRLRWSISWEGEATSVYLGGRWIRCYTQARILEVGPCIRAADPETRTLSIDGVPISPRASVGADARKLGS